MPEKEGYGKPKGKEGGDPAPTGDGGNIRYRKNEGTADPQKGGVPPEETDKSGLDVSIGKG